MFDKSFVPMIFLRRLFLYFLPALMLIYGGDKMSDVVTDYPPHNKVYKMICYLVGVAIVNIIVPISAEKMKRDLEQQEALIGILLKELRKSLNDELEALWKMRGLELNIRIFSPRRSFKLWLKRMITGRRVFYLNDLPNLCVEPMDNLSFTVWPMQEGLVGRVYADKHMLYDSAPDDERARALYRLSPYQNNITADTKCIIAAPIFKDGANGRVKAVVTFDTCSRVALPDSKDWEPAIRDSCKILHKCIPFICKKHVK